MKKTLLGVVAGIVIGGAAAAFFYKQNLDRLDFALTLFSGAEQYENFNRMAELYPVSRMPAAGTPFRFAQGTAVDLPASFSYESGSVDTETFLSETDTSALLVLQNGAVRFERYSLTGGRDVNWLSMSVAKSFISAAIGIAVEEGAIKSIEDPVTDYAPSLKGSAYDNVRIKDILQMSSGARWNEDYSDPNSDVNGLGKIMGVGGSLNSFLTTMEREREPGTYNHYNSMDTQVLGLLLMRATGRSISDFIAEKLWQPLGMETEGQWMVDSEGTAMAFGGLNATARDYAKLGELYRLGGAWEGRQIVPATWVQASVTPDAPHLMPGENALSDYPMGYGYQWWIMDGDDGEYSAIGVYNQFIYINPAKGIVIVKLSANSDYATSLDESAYREFETIEFFRAIGDSID